MAAEYFSCHSLSEVLVKQHSCDLELSCIFGNVRGNVWIGPLGVLRIAGRSFRLPLGIPESKYFAASQNLLVWNTGQLKFFAYHTSASVGRGFFCSQTSAHCNLGTLFLLGYSVWKKNIKYYWTVICKIYKQVINYSFVQDGMVVIN